MSLYIFQCPLCGEYPVKKKTFMGFITPKKWKAVKNAVAKGAVGGKAIFSQYCPRCELGGRSILKVGILWPKQPLENKDPVS